MSQNEYHFHAIKTIKSLHKNYNNDKMEFDNFKILANQTRSQTRLHRISNFILNISIENMREWRKMVNLGFDNQFLNIKAFLFVDDLAIIQEVEAILQKSL